MGNLFENQGDGVVFFFEELVREAISALMPPKK
jgi:hypothetical protein